MITGTVSLGGEVFAGKYVVTLSSNNKDATVPKTVTILPGASSGTFLVGTKPVSKQQTVTITAKNGAIAKTGTAVIFPPTLASLTLRPSSVASGASSIGTVTLNGAAEPGGVTVKLMTNSRSATVPKAVTVMSGKTAATFQVKTVSVSSQTGVAISAELGNAVETADLTISAPSLNSLTLSPSTVAGGKSSVGTVTLTSSAPTGGLVVHLSSSLASATVPNEVTIPGGRIAATFVIKTIKVSSKSTASITVSFGGATKTAALTIN
jgi:hypothetical protein